jgi:MFS-type transporter involved in bile tolerance (Atg22 family)
LRNSGLAAWAFYDWANSAFPTVILTFVFASYFTREVAPNEALGATFWGNAVAAAEISVAVLGPMLGAIADQTGKNKRWLAAFTLLCAISTALFGLYGLLRIHCGSQSYSSFLLGYKTNCSVFMQCQARLRLL